MNRFEPYKLRMQAALKRAAAALTCVTLMCGLGNVVAQPVTTDGDRWKEHLPDTEAPVAAVPRWVAKHFDDPDRQKYVLFDDPNFQLKGWTNGVVRWRYNDSGRNASVIGASTAAETIATLQAAQAKWTAACNVQFIYEGTTTAVPTPLNMSGGNLDNISTVGWTALPGSTTGVAGIAYSGSPPLPIVEGDIAYTNVFSHNLSVTALHETGHLLGIDHSDFQNVVMSGPPLTNYVSLSTLQPDDIAACVFLYGAPVMTSRTISGTISNGATPLAGVTFCASQATGVTCTASNGSGAYSCTVPNGWSGLLHAPGPAGLRIKPQSFTNVSANLSGQNPIVQAIGACNLDVDNNGLIEPGTDGVAILRRMLGISSTGFSGLSGTCAANTTSATIFNATTSNYNATGGALTRPGTDGLVILRAMRGLTGTAVTNGLGLAAESGATNTTWAAIRNNFLNTTCGADFLP